MNSCTPQGSHVTYGLSFFVSRTSNGFTQTGQGNLSFVLCAMLPSSLIVAAKGFGQIPGEYRIDFGFKNSGLVSLVDQNGGEDFAQNSGPLVRNVA